MITFKKKKIILPFDFSAPARNAVDQVFEWADESNEIHLIYVVVPTPTVIDMNPPVWMPPNLDTDARDNMLKRMKEQIGADRNSSVDHYSIIGDPGTEIVELAKRVNADVIIMPSHGRTGISRFFLGSVAERVLRLSECPVFVLRGKRYENDDAEEESVE